MHSQISVVSSARTPTALRRAIRTHEVIESSVSAPKTIRSIASLRSISPSGGSIPATAYAARQRLSASTARSTERVAVMSISRARSSARNVERAEDPARLIDITATRSVDRAVDAESRWRAAYAVAGIEPPEGEIERNDAIERIVFGAETLLSITSCVRIARRNAVGVRAELTTEIWECINGLYLFVEAQSLRAIGPDGASSFLHAIRESAQRLGFDEQV